MAGFENDGDRCMTTSSYKKRLAAVEIALTPKEWAIRLADQIRSHPSELDFLKTIAKETFEASPIIHPFRALKDQAEERHPGEKPEDVDARIRLQRAVRTEFHGLKELINTVNKAVQIQGEIVSLKAALKLARLETIVLREAFGRTARNAVELVQQHITAYAEEEERRQGVIEELAAYSYANIEGKGTDSDPFPAVFPLHFPSPIERWVDEVVALVAGVWAQRAAIQAVQDQYFDGHPILFVDVEDGLNETIKTLEDCIAIFNAYLKTRVEFFKGEPEGRLAIDVDAVRAAAVKLHTKRVAAAWIKHAKQIAKAEILAETNEHGAFLWDRLRNEFGVNP